MPRSSALVLVGPMGAGKTSVGRRVAKTLQVPFIDTDAVVQRAHGPIDEIFAVHGEAVFRGWEREAVAAAVREDGVVSLGGGAVTDADTREDLRACDVVLLTVEPRVVAGRILGTARPLLQGEDPMQRWQRIYLERLPLYEEVADITFDTSHGPLQGIVDAIVAWSNGRAATHEPKEQTP